jgi:aspartyl-tRNA(Asn)/glutamyl-tRNA(Gln) amidotransferase subunit A
VYHALLGNTSARPLAAAPLGSVRLGVPRPYFCDLLDDEIRSAFEAALDRLRAAGARVHEIEIRHARDIAPVYLHLGLAEAAAYHAKGLQDAPDRYTPPVRLRLEMGRHILAEDYVRAGRGREALRREVDAALSEHDAIVLPTLPIPAPIVGANSVQIGGAKEPVRNLMLRLTQLFNLTGHPAVSLPCGHTSAGLPCGLQLAGVRMQTDALLGIALASEAALSRT